MKSEWTSSIWRRRKPNQNPETAGHKHNDPLTPLETPHAREAAKRRTEEANKTRAQQRPISEPWSTQRGLSHQPSAARLGPACSSSSCAIMHRHHLPVGDQGLSPSPRLPLELLQSDWLWLVCRRLSGEGRTIEGAWMRGRICHCL